jgi:MFS transporter, ACS family, allantoate permease
MADLESSEKTVQINDHTKLPYMEKEREPSPVDAGAHRPSVSSTAAAKKILEHSNDADEAMKAFANGETVEIDEATNKRLLRTIDLHLMPLLCLIYGLNYLDKTTLSYVSPWTLHC